MTICSAALRILRTRSLIRLDQYPAGFRTREWNGVLHDVESRALFLHDPFLLEQITLGTMSSFNNLNGLGAWPNRLWNLMYGKGTTGFVVVGKNGQYQVRRKSKPDIANPLTRFRLQGHTGRLIRNQLYWSCPSYRPAVLWRRWVSSLWYFSTENAGCLGAVTSRLQRTPLLRAKHNFPVPNLPA